MASHRQIIFIGVISALLSLSAISRVSAVIFHDDFDRLIDDRWGHPNRQIWSVENGMLHVKQPVGGGKGKNIMPITYLLKFTARPGPYNDFAITVTNLVGGSFGIALGKRFPEILGNDVPSWYIFTPSYVDGRSFRPNDSGGGIAPFAFQGWVDGRPKSAWPKQCKGKWETASLRKMVIRFSNGRFRMIADGVLRIDFRDPHFDKIELIGFLLMGNMEVGGSTGWADSFTLSDSLGYGIDPRDRIMMIWGALKTGSFIPSD